MIKRLATVLLILPACVLPAAVLVAALAATSGLYDSPGAFVEALGNRLAAQTLGDWLLKIAGLICLVPVITIVFYALMIHGPHTWLDAPGIDPSAVTYWISEAPPPPGVVVVNPYTRDPDSTVLDLAGRADARRSGRQTGGHITAIMDLKIFNDLEPDAMDNAIWLLRNGESSGVKLSVRGLNHD